MRNKQVIHRNTKISWIQIIAYNGTRVCENKAEHIGILQSPYALDPIILTIFFGYYDVLNAV